MMLINLKRGRVKVLTDNVRLINCLEDMTLDQSLCCSKIKVLNYMQRSFYPPNLHCSWHWVSACSFASCSYAFCLVLSLQFCCSTHLGVVSHLFYHQVFSTQFYVHCLLVATVSTPSVIVTVIDSILNLDSRQLS